MGGAPPDAFGIAIGRHATVDSIISVTRLIPCAGAQYVTPAEKNMLLCEAAANGKLMKEYGIISRKPRALGYVAAGLAVLGGRFPSNSVRTFNCKAAAGAFDVANPTADQLGMWLTRLCKLNSLLGHRERRSLPPLTRLTPQNWPPPLHYLPRTSLPSLIPSPSLSPSPSSLPRHPCFLCRSSLRPSATARRPPTHLPFAACRLP